jgi:hypothetical protein
LDKRQFVGQSPGPHQGFRQLGYAFPDRIGTYLQRTRRGRRTRLKLAAQEDLFKSFHMTKPNRLGLGLSICRSIVDWHGGSSWANPNAPHQRHANRGLKRGLGRRSGSAAIGFWTAR